MPKTSRQLGTVCVIGQWRHRRVRRDPMTGCRGLLAEGLSNGVSAVCACRRVIARRMRTDRGGTVPGWRSVGAHRRPVHGVVRRCLKATAHSVWRRRSPTPCNWRWPLAGNLGWSVMFVRRSSRGWVSEPAMSTSWPARIRDAKREAAASAIPGTGVERRCHGRQPWSKARVHAACGTG